MNTQSKQRRDNEPPGPRRVYLALRAAGSSQERVAEACNCGRAVVSAVVHGACSTDLHTRVRAALAEATGVSESWLFEHCGRTRTFAEAS
jgi:transcriptional regulator with XRE-family HTH domain